jgi:ATP-dependent helicase/nuclease subunit A
MSFRPVDQDARERARSDHGTSLVVEAGAGTGKTTLLIDRIESLVRSGAARLDEIAAVTFTENAATTMKLRLRERLEAARVGAGLPPEERARAAEALEVLERANSRRWTAVSPSRRRASGASAPRCAVWPGCSSSSAI